MQEILLTQLHIMRDYNHRRSSDERTCEANTVGENQFKSVQHYHFQLAYVVLQMAVKEFFETHFYEGRNRSF